jgi:hypothetical protein
VLASLLAVPERAIDDADLALFDRLLDRQVLDDKLDDWWRIVALARRAYFMEFWRRDYPAVDAVERRAEPLCKALHSGWCSRIALLAGGAHSQMGRADLAIERLTAALREARLARLPVEATDALDALGEAIGIRVAEDIDSAVVGGAYLTEVALRNTTCRYRLQRLHFATLWALQHHRFDEAAGYRRDADAVEQEECPDTSPRVNGETARLRLLLSGRGNLATFRRAVAPLETGNHEERRLYRAFLDAAATLVEDRPRGEAALRQVIAAASADPTVPYAPLVRASAYDALIEVSGDARAVLDLLSERMAAPRFERCALGIAQWNRLVVAALDGRGQPALEVHEVHESMMMIPPAEAVSPAIRARLADCPRVDVVAAAPYLGAPRLLEDRVAWVYHAAAPRPAGHAAAHEVVVSEVAPPDDLHLPALRAYAGSPGAEVLSGARATPAAVLAAMRTASLAVIVAHGVTDAAEPTAASLILSPDPQGDYLLTASKVRAATLLGSPVVVLAGCDAGRVQVSAEPWSLATSFLHAGARVVIAPTAPIPDDTANDVFRSLIDRIRAGADPAEALVAERTARQAAAPWLSSIVIFE